MPDEDYHLTQAERAGLQSDLDHDAVEGLLRALPPEARPVVLRLARDWSRADPEECLAAFPELTPGGPVGRRTFMVPQFDDLRTDDPEMQTALDAVLRATTWWAAGAVMLALEMPAAFLRRHSLCIVGSSRLEVPMIVPRTSVLLLGAAMACAAPGPSPSTSNSVAPRPRMDSATAERLCVRPDWVRAGWAECVLKDQSPPLRQVPRPPPPR